MRLIDADALKAEMIRIQNLGIGEAATMVFCAVIDGQPEAVVRCEDCIYWDTQDRSTVGIAKCNYQSVARYLTYTDADDFCSHGERKTDETH